jgi:hypothetical protein
MIQKLWSRLTRPTTPITEAPPIPETSPATPKIFCVGMNKTGTTSIDAALRALGYCVAPQAPAELLIHEWAKRDFAALIEFCHTADAFQDIPFSLPFTYQALDQHFPQSKFILTMRSSSEEWYRSICSFHGKLWNNGQIPQMHHLKAAKYRYLGYAYEAFKYVYNTPDDDLYNQSMLITFYERHNAAIKEYFRYRPDDLLVLNVSQPNAYHQLCDFLGKPRVDAAFPWENKTDTITHRAI